jgi:stress response protein YsnF
VETGVETAAATGVGAGAGTDAAMTRSEEQLRVHTESAVAGRVRLRKYVVTEYQTVTVPVRREEIRVERVPVGDDEAADLGEPVTGGSVMGGTGAVGGSVAGRAVADPSAPVDVDGEQEIILYAERPVVQTETVAVERIRVGKETVTEQETVTGEVRREEIVVDTDRDVDTDPRPRDVR